ncbi:matrixin family metalloprotease [Longimicrobium sp.]|uniref:matrixin family metalloprotease n=1 Tax=Longimicrobium sp. TaxID=2029185 RepID=UPI002C4BC65F|nr:matrixin family metalloprotease [Longimicrobium sp.]HSU15774.1 matrixin family metalloprotease [Longimicrobium sp.]
MELLARLGREVDLRLGTAHHVAAPLEFRASKDGKLASAALLDALLDRAEAEDAAPGEHWMLAVADAPLHAPGHGRVFGEAAIGSGCAVMGLGALDGGKRCDAMTLLGRAVKEAVHELGHAAGLAHCADPRCVMYPSRHIADTDRKAERFCARCRDDFAHVTLDAARG